MCRCMLQLSATLFLFFFSMFEAVISTNYKARCTMEGPIPDFAILITVLELIASFFLDYSACNISANVYFHSCLCAIFACAPRSYYLTVANATRQHIPHMPLYRRMSNHSNQNTWRDHIAAAIAKLANEQPRHI